MASSVRMLGLDYVAGFDDGNGLGPTGRTIQSVRTLSPEGAHSQEGYVGNSAGR
jgi:hypothetical protein